MVLAGGAASPAAADSNSGISSSSNVLPAASLGDIVTDGVHQRVFISDPASGNVLATDYSGKVVATIGSLPGVHGLELSADSSTLYAAVPGADAIAAIDTAALKESARYDTGAGTKPKYPALAGGKLWFGYGSGTGSNIGSLDLSGEDPVVALGQDATEDATRWRGTPVLVSTPGAPDMLAAAASHEPGWPFMVVYDVASGAATRTASGWSGGGPLNDLALSPDGRRLLLANTLPTQYHLSFRTSDLGAEELYPAAPSPSAVDVAPNGTVATGTSGSASKVRIHPEGTTKAVRTYDLFKDGAAYNHQTLEPAGLAWAPDSSRLFAVTVNEYGKKTRSLRVLTDTTKSVPSLELKAPAKAPRAKKLTVTGKATATVPFPAGSKVTVVRTDIESPKGKSLGTAALKPDGSFSFTDTPPAGGTVKYTAAFAGDAAHTGSSFFAAVNVSLAKTSLKLNRNKSLHAYDKNVSFTATLGKTHKNRVVELWADPFGTDKPKKLIKKAKVDSKGNLSATVNLRRDTTVTAVFAGDSRYAYASAKSTAYAQVKVSTTLAKHYRTAKIGKTSYAYFKKKTNPSITTAMTYHKGRAQRLSVQLNHKGTWYDAGKEYFALGSNGKSVVALEGPHRTGYKMRVRSSYVDGTSGDNVNATTHGAWKYFIFTK